MKSEENIMDEIQGNVESIVFKNEENGYVVATLNHEKKKTTIVGTIPFISEGMTLKVSGSLISHAKFGEQLKVETAEEVMPSTLVGMENYLSSGVVRGIGAVTARKIIEHFGEESINILDNNIDRLREIEGIGEKKINIIKESYSKQRGVKKVMLFLQTYGITANKCNKVYKKYGDRAIEIVKMNPYILTEEISGIGFKIADKIARNLGVEKNSSFRIKSGIEYIVNNFSSFGNTYMPLEKLLNEGVDILSVKREEIENNIIESTIDMKLKVEEFNNENCVFSMPFYYSELLVTNKIIMLATNGYEKINIDIDKEIKEFEDKNKIFFADSQKEAIKGAIENGVEVITGGPGTGKTTIINCIINIFEKASMKVLMAAPTGRAAKRMSEATGKEAKTIHRLLEIGYSDDDDISAFGKGEESPLSCDVVIVDEASMIDIILMGNLLKAVSAGTRLIIVGDVDQLPSVGPGNVLRDIINSNAIKVVRLKDIFRQGKESMIVVNAHKINSGDMPDLNVKDKDFFFIKKEAQEEILKEILGLVDKRLGAFNKDWDKVKSIQVLTPMRRGKLGIETLNKELQDVLNPFGAMKKEIEQRDTIFRVGDKVIQTKNNYTLKWERIKGDGDGSGEGVFNGDIGYISDIDEEEGSLKVLFDDERRVQYYDVNLDELDLAYALTIHKSQGSEFPVVIIPLFMGPPMLMNRNLLYTAVTRAKALVVLVGSTKALSFMVGNTRSAERYSALSYRISQIM